MIPVGAAPLVLGNQAAASERITFDQDASVAVLVVDHIVVPVAIEDIGVPSRAASQVIVTATPFEYVVARATVQVITTRPAGQGIVASSPKTYCTALAGRGCPVTAISGSEAIWMPWPMSS